MISKELQDFLTTNDFEKELPDVSEIERKLYAALKEVALTETPKEVYPVVTIEGKTGSGKTSRVAKWARDNQVNLVRKDASIYRVFEQMMRVDKNHSLDQLYELEFGQLDMENSVLVLDDYHFASEEAQNFVTPILETHKIPNKEADGGVKKLGNWLFTVTIKSV